MRDGRAQVEPGETLPEPGKQGEPGNPAFVFNGFSGSFCKKYIYREQDACTEAERWLRDARIGRAENIHGGKCGDRTAV
jgi:hypothetical protein